MRRPILDKKTAVQTGSVARAGVGGSQAIASATSAAEMFSRLVESGVSLPEMTEAVEKWFVLHKLEAWLEQEMGLLEIYRRPRTPPRCFRDWLNPG